MYHRVHISNIKNYHDDEHFYRTKISIFSPLKIEKLTAKDLKCSNEDKKTNFQKFIFQIPKSGVPGRYSKKRNSNWMKLGRSLVEKYWFRFVGPLSQSDERFWAHQFPEFINNHETQKHCLLIIFYRISSSWSNFYFLINNNKSRRFIFSRYRAELTFDWLRGVSN